MRGVGNRRDKLPQELQERLKRADALMKEFMRPQSRGESDEDLLKRKTESLIFSIPRGKRGIPGRLRFLLQSLVNPLDRNSVVFTDFLRAGVVEVIVDERYKKDLIAAVWQYRWRYEKDKTPLSKINTKTKLNTKADGMYVNATRLLNRANFVLERVQHPLVQRHFREMKALAQLAVQRAEAQGAKIDPSVFRAKTATAPPPVNAPLPPVQAPETSAPQQNPSALPSQVTTQPPTPVTRSGEPEQPTGGGEQGTKDAMDVSAPSTSDDYVAAQ